MAFDGSYPRQVRERGVVHQIYVRRARCGRCGTGEALLPDFTLRRRLDSAAAVGAAVLARHGRCSGSEVQALYSGVPARTVRSWHQRFFERADDLMIRFEALRAQWGAGGLPHYEPTRVAVTITSIGSLWQAARRRPNSDVPPPWRLANLVVGGQLLGTRVDLPWPVVSDRIGRAQGP